jgi:inosine-uridine nucleoside N-ribohydrolase
MEDMTKLLSALFFCIAATAQTRVWIDADTANEIDDLYAITRMLAAQDLEIVALSSAHWSKSPAAEGNTLEASQRLNEALLGLTGRMSIPHPRGSAVGVYWWGADRAAYSAAAYHLIRAARDTPAGEKLTVIALGALTNVASALMIEPSIAPKMRLYWLGAFIDTERGVWDKSEFNCLNDIPALNEVLNRRELELRVMPASVARALTFEYAFTAERLARHGRLGEFLLARWKQHAPGASTWIMWDLAAVEWVLKPELVKWKRMRTPPENTQREVDAAVSIDAEAMRADFWQAIGQLTRNAGRN